MRIGQIAAESGVPPKTLRFWEDLGIIPEPARTASGYRDYEPDIIDRLAFVRHAQSAGFTLEQIRGILIIGDSGEPPCAHVGELIAKRLEQLDTRIAQLAITRERLTALAKRAVAQDPAACQGYCSIITG
jgi:DNA-binding transcriptional MerR regulator